MNSRNWQALRIMAILILTLISGIACNHAPNPPGPNPLSAEIGTQNLASNIVRSRAMESALWGMSAVNYDAMYQAALKVGMKDNQFIYWSKPCNWQNQFLTPNTDALYFLPFYNTKAGPIVVEIPSATNGTIVGTLMDCWQTPLEDVGPAGADAGRGGKYLILPPDYTGKVPLGYIVLRSSTYAGYALLRSIPKTTSDQDIAKAVAYGKTIKLYPLATGSNQRQSTFVDASGQVLDAAIPYDLRFFESLNRIIQTEPWISRDRGFIDIVKSIGMGKGKTFSPDTSSKTLLIAALADAHATLDKAYESNPPYYRGKHWFWPIGADLLKAWASGFTDSNSYPIDQRAGLYYWGFSSGKRTGAGDQHQLYFFGDRDKDNNPLDGSKSYKLLVPAKVPVSQYWSATAYNRATHTLIRDMPYSSRSSLTRELVTNDDGTVDIYFGPTAPEGKQSNWIPTKAGEHFEIIFRLYGFGKAIIDKSWVLPDVEEIK